MYLVVIGWLYVAAMMAVAEASNSTGSLLGAIVTFFLYGLMPVALVFYLMTRSARRKAARLKRLAEAPEADGSSNAPPDASGHATGTAKQDSVTPVRKEL